jgi:ATP-dependent helicase/nuclease subunit B
MKQVTQPWVWVPGAAPAQAWRAWATEASAWLVAQNVDVREAWVILPVGAVLLQARQAWAQAVGGWLPRIDTIAGLVDGLGWSHVPPAWGGALAEVFAAPVSLDSVIDRLHAHHSLGAQAWAKQWAQRDPRGFEFAVDQVVDAAQTWLRALQVCPPGERQTQASSWREVLGQGAGGGGGGGGAPSAGPGAAGPGHREALLLAWALEWAAASGEQGFASDLLFAGAGGVGPSAWVVVHAGETVAPGSEGALTFAAAAHATRHGVPVRRWVARPGQVGHPEGASMDGRMQAPQVSLLACADALDEARQAAAAILRAVNACRMNGQASGHSTGLTQPVALIAIDRSVVRHARALLDDMGVSLADETGWRLSTTRAASVCSRLLAAANPRASTDELLDWLKSGWLVWETPLTSAGAGLDEAVGQLEAWCRQHGLVQAWALAAITEVPGGPGRSLAPEAQEVWRWARTAVAPLQAVWRERRATLSDWLHALHEALAACGAGASLRADEAGALAWTALRLDDFPLQPEAVAEKSTGSAPTSNWLAVCQRTRMDGAAVQRWVREVLEDVTFRPAAPEGTVDVVITTLARAVLRPFAAVVMPGADERQLGALPSAAGWLGQSTRAAMGLSTVLQLRDAQWEAFSLLLTQADVTCLHRCAQGSESREASPWLMRWAQGRHDAVLSGLDPRDTLTVAPLPTHRPVPSLAGAGVGLPAQVSATSYEQLRECPYRFFAVSVLGLRQADELEEGLEASEHGIWLHEVLRCFHEDRAQALALGHADEDVAQWLAVARAVAAASGLNSEGQRAHFLPFAAALPALARAYVGWLRAHEADGWSVRATEASIQQALALADGSSLQLYGQLDRIDVRHEQRGDAAPRHEVRWVLDYKTGNADRLRARAQSGSEDTQLAFYAALGAHAQRRPGEPGANVPVDIPTDVPTDVPTDIPADLRAGYVHLDPKAVKVLEHAGVAESAEALLQGLAGDWLRLREGSPMPALGEGAVCGHCHARGLCRRDHWTLPRLEEARDGR